MCGIAGIVSADRRDHDDMPKVLKALGHRGPDDEGVYSQPSVTLGHRRLSIIDLSPAGHQPMPSRDGRFVITFNGEIYNYVELAEELGRLGWEFAGHSDTEVLLAAWGQWGPGCLSRLVGMFAFAVLDRWERTVTLVRDPFGVKPLFFSSSDRRFLFASEIAALLEHPTTNRRVDPWATYDYLRWGLTDHTHRTMFADIKHVPPASVLVVPIDHPDRRTVSTYWSVPTEALDVSFTEASSRLRALFLDSVRMHLRSDVPVGAALSGGIDSSAIVSAMRHLAGEQLELHAFSYTSDDSTLNEELYLDLAATSAKAIVHRVRVTSRDLLDELDQLVLSQGEPFGGTSLLAQRRVFAAAADEGIKVLLDGQGADELFGGYRRFLARRFADLVRRGSIISATKLARSVRALPDVSLDRRVLAAVASTIAPMPFRQYLQGVAGREAFPPWLKRDWFLQRGVEGDPQPVDGDLASALSETSLPALLRYEDRNSMTVSRESRVPFLSIPLVEFVFSLPREYLLALDGTSKHIFREAMRGLVPDPILDRRDKIGFSTPEATWLEQQRSAVNTILLRSTTWPSHPLQTEVCRAATASEPTPRGVDGHTTWRWVNFIRWRELFDVEF